MRKIILILVVLIVSCKKHDIKPIVEEVNSCQPKKSELLSGKYISISNDTIQIVYSNTDCNNNNYNTYSIKYLYKLFPKRLRDYSLLVNETSKCTESFIDSIQIFNTSEGYIVVSQGDKWNYKLRKI